MAYWSGILDADSTEREVEYVVPDYFNGTLRVMAVAVSDEAIGVHESHTISRGDFVLSPNAPTTVTPGDEFEVSVGVSNQLAGSGEAAQIAVRLKTDAALQILGPAAQTVAIAGAPRGLWRASGSVCWTCWDRLASSSPPAPAIRRYVDGWISAFGRRRRIMTTLRAGTFKNGSKDVRVERALYPEHRTLSASTSLVPLSLAHGLTAYLANYPYAVHGATGESGGAGSRAGGSAGVWLRARAGGRGPRRA